MAEFTGKERDMDRDDVLSRVHATLAPLPAADPQAIARVLSAVHGRRQSRRSLLDRMRMLPASLFATMRLSPVSLIGGSTIVVAAVVSVMVIRGTPPPRIASDATVASSPAVVAPVSGDQPGTAPSGPSDVAPTPVHSGAERDLEAMQPVQFVLDAAGATSVAVVGDFNDWSLTAAVMQRVPGAGIWTTTIAIPPGRHVYAFVIDGTRWIADPRAPRAVDSDFGKPGSVLMVNSR